MNPPPSFLYSTLLRGSVLLSLLFTLAGNMVVAAEERAPMAPAAAAVAPQKIGKDMRCPVCGMFPARYPKWQAQVIFQHGDLRAIDSPLDLFRYLHNLPRYERQQTTQGRAAIIAAIYLTDYLKGGWVDARQAYFVAGSSARGPMNNADLPAFNGRAAAEKFAASQGGRVLAFEEITPELLANLEHAGHADHSAHTDHDHHDHQDHQEHHGHHDHHTH